MIRRGRRPGLAGRVGDGLGQGLERGQRPAGDRSREPAVDEPAKPGSRGRKSCSIVTRVGPSAVGSIRHVTSMPLRRAGDVRNRRRRSRARSTSVTAR